MEPSEKKMKLEELQESQAKSILDLNDDCLIEIFSYYSIEELMELEKVCPRFGNVAEEYFYKKQKVLKINGAFHKRTQIAEMAERMGPYVSTLDIVDRYYTTSVSKFTDVDVLKPLWIHCTRLQHLTIRNTNLMIHLELMKDIFKNLKSAILVDCDLTDEIGDYLKTAPELDNLSLEENPKITGNFLPDLKHELKEINVEGCDNIFQGPYFGEFCRNNLQLESLAISLLYGNTPHSLNANLAELTNLTKLILLNPQLIPASNIVPHFPKLTHLEILRDSYSSSEENNILYRFLDHVGNMDCLEYLRIDEDAIALWSESITKVYNRILPKFTKLKVLDLSSKYEAEFADFHLLNISMKCRQTIEYLEICKSRKITDKGLLEFLKDCPNIKNLDLRSCNKITDDFIYELMPICDQRPHTLMVLAYRTKMTGYVEEYLEYTKYQKIKFREGSSFYYWRDSEEYEAYSIDSDDSNNSDD